LGVLQKGIPAGGSGVDKEKTGEPWSFRDGPFGFSKAKGTRNGGKIREGPTSG